MAPKLKRSSTGQQRILSQWNGGRTTHWETPENGSSVHEIQKYPNPSQFKDVPLEKNHLNPPYHWHWYQTEYFEIKQGYDFSYSFLRGQAHDIAGASFLT
jgi:hypothetical protein